MIDENTVSRFAELVGSAKTILVIQAENPDGDSLGSALALEEILGDMGKQVSMYCPVNIPSYLGYIKGWDRVTDEFSAKFDMSIIVDTASAVLLERAIIPEQRAAISQKPCIVLDHHTTEGTIPFETITITDPTKVATGELIFDIAKLAKWAVNPQACEDLAIAIMSDSLGLVSEATTSSTVHCVAELLEGGASLAAIEERRRDYMKKSPEILNYKGQLLQRVEYFNEGSLAIVHVTWEEITKYSSQYNPGILVIDEMRLVNKVKVAIVLKTYPDGKITGKVRANPGYKVAETIARFFGGGGHPYVAGFRTYSDNYEEVKNELIKCVAKTLEENSQT
jgi:bifunctional oligoribonuclease and PAP phosphatase NrnA